MDKLGVALADCESKCKNFYGEAEVKRVFYPEMETLLLEFFPDATDALAYNTTCSTRTTTATAPRTRPNKNAGVNANYAPTSGTMT